MMNKKAGLHYGSMLIGMVGLLIVLIAAAFAYLKFGPVPVAVADGTMPFEKPIVRIAVRARIARQTQVPPFAANESVFEAGAGIYQRRCAICHGTPGRDAALFHQMFPAPPQLWKKHGPHGVVGVSDDDSGFSYWAVSNGIRLSGMPSFAHTLSDNERWEVSLLLKNADKDLSPEVSRILSADESH